MKMPDHFFKNHRFPSEIIQYAVWLYYVLPLSFRDVELLLHQRGIVVSHEAIRGWCYKFGPHFAHRIRQKRRSATHKWHLDEVFVVIKGQRYSLWRAVDSQGIVLDVLLQTRRNAQAAKCFFNGVLGKTATQTPVLVTDGLRSYNIYLPRHFAGCRTSTKSIFEQSSGKCTHYGTPLYEGVLRGHSVMCPWHHTCFDVRSGERLEPPALNNLAHYPVWVENGTSHCKPATRQQYT